MDTNNGLLKQRDSGNANWLPQAVRGVPHGGGIRFSGQSTPITGSSTLTSAVLGQLVLYNPSAPITSTLPLANTFPEGTGFFVYNYSETAAVTFAPQSGNTTDPGPYAYPGDQFLMMSDGYSLWRPLLRSSQYSQTVNAYPSNTNWVRLPGGIIMQIGSWTQTTSSGGGGAVVFPNSFPDGVMSCLLTSGDNNSQYSIQGISSQLTVNGAGFEAFNAGSPFGNAAVRVNFLAFGF